MNYNYLFFLCLLTSHAITTASQQAPQPLTMNVRLSPDMVHDIAALFTTMSANAPLARQAITKEFSAGLKEVGEGYGNAIIPARNQLWKIALGLTSTIAAGFILTHLCNKYIDKRFGEPVLIEKQSPHTLWGKITSSWKEPVDITNHMVISKDVATDLNYIIATTENIRKNGGQFENAIFHGPPGTGKTLFAKLLSQGRKMDYAFIPAANISQFFANGKAVEELNNLFAWASSKKNGTILFFDEAETFLADRSTLHAAAQNALSAFLAKTGTPSDKIMIICATNKPETIDGAALSRFPMQVEFRLPDLQDRKDQLVMHIKNIFGSQKGTHVEYAVLQDPNTITTIATQLEGCSGRTIQQFVNRLRQRALAENTLTITDNLIRIVTQQMIANREFNASTDRIKSTLFDAIRSKHSAAAA